MPVPYEQLPVELNTELFLNEETNTNAQAITKCPKCGSVATKETDTMDTFVDSSWYFLRYLDVNNEKEPFDLEKVNKQMPVDIYVGGIEHAMTHLFVSRLITHFLYYQNKLKFKEPFTRFLAMGMIKGETYTTKSGKYLPADKVQAKNNKYYECDSNEQVFKHFEKMSKSKLNGVDPEFMISQYGIDFTRLFLVNFVHPKSDRNFARIVMLQIFFLIN